MSGSNRVLYESQNGIARLTINRPEKLNALDRLTMQEIDRAVAAAEEDASAGVLIVTGMGEKAFGAGADIGELASQTPVEGAAFARRGQEVLNRLERLGKPSIAAINGYALGGGLELAMACTLRLAADTAKLGQPEVALGIIPGYGGTQRLSRLVGPGRALEILLTGEPIDAREAPRIGLVNRVVPAAA
ncbi:MAG: enoyl-CoA hydratase/isomerase family protein, partial [Acidobacteriota bacterium]